jgi:hypothetical protein
LLGLVPRGDDVSAFWLGLPKSHLGELSLNLRVSLGSGLLMITAIRQRGADHQETFAMNRTSIIALAAAAIFAGIGLGPSVASAGESLRADKRDIRAD